MAAGRIAPRWLWPFRRRHPQGNVLAFTIDASRVHRSASKFSNAASVAVCFVETGGFDSAILPEALRRSWQLFEKPMRGPFPADYDAFRNIQLPDRAIPFSTAVPKRRLR